MGNQQSNYDLELLLEEAKMRAHQRRKQPSAPSAPPSEPKAESVSVSTVKPARAMVSAPEAETDVKIYKPKSTLSDLFRVKAAETPPPPPAPVQAAEEDTAEIVLPPHEAATRTFSLEQSEPAAPAKPVEESVMSDGLDGQLTFETLEDPSEEADGEHTPIWTQQDERALEARLRETRRSKIENFRLLGGEEEENDPTEQPEPEEEDEIEDYSSYEQTEMVENELLYRRRLGMAGVLFTGAMELALTVLTVLMHLTASIPTAPITYLIINSGFLLLMMLINHRTIADGLSGLRHLRANADSGTAVVSIVTLIHTLLQFFSLTEVANGQTLLFGAAAGLGLLFSAIGRQCRLSRICRNFRFVSCKGEKYAARRVDSAATAEQLARGVFAVGTPSLTYFGKSTFLTQFLENSYEDDGSDRLMRRFVPFLLLLSVVGAVLYTCSGDERANWWNAITVLVSILCAGMPAFAAVSTHLPILRIACRALQHGAMLVGWKAVDTFSNTNGLTVNAADLFPSEQLLLHGIKTFSGTRIDEAILDAAAVSIRAGGPLSGVFLRVIENRTDMLQEVDTLIYEQEMGLSGWVGGRRVLVGNRRLLENHGVDVPSRDYEQRYTKDGRSLVYLSTGGELSAMFVVSYLAEEGIRRALQGLSRAGIHLLVRTCDPNITERMLCDTFGLEEDAVTVMDVAAGRVYEKLTDQSAEEFPALLASNGRVEGMATALTACRRIRARSTRALIAQLLTAGCGLLFSLLFTLYAGKVLPPLYVLGYLVFGAGLSWIVTLFGKNR